MIRSILHPRPPAASQSTPRANNRTVQKIIVKVMLYKQCTLKCERLLHLHESLHLNESLFDYLAFYHFGTEQGEGVNQKITLYLQWKSFPHLQITNMLTSHCRERMAKWSHCPPPHFKSWSRLVPLNREPRLLHQTSHQTCKLAMILFFCHPSQSQ